MDALVRDAYRAHFALQDQPPRVAEAAALLATVTGQDIEETADGRFAIFEGTAPDRVISTVDPQARHGHKTAAHGFDGYKAHVAIDPDVEVITAAEVSAATSGDAAVAPTLLSDLASGEGDQAAQAVVYGDSAYGTGAHLAWLAQQGFTPMIKTQVPTAPGGRLAKDQFRIDLQAQTVTCPARVTVAIPARRGGGHARFGVACSVCPLRQACTSSVGGRVVTVHPREAELAAARSVSVPPPGRLPGHPTQGRAQARAPAAPPPRWPPRPRPGAGPRGPGFQAAGGRGQPGSLGHLGCALPAPAGSSSPPDGGDQRPAPTGNRYLNAAELLQLVREHRPPSEAGGGPRSSACQQPLPGTSCEQLSWWEPRSPAQGGGIWPDGSWHARPPAASTPPTNPGT